MGCKVSAPLAQKGDHERSCEYLQLKCPFHGQCSFSGALTMVVPHLKASLALTCFSIKILNFSTALKIVNFSNGGGGVRGEFLYYTLHILL